MTQTLFDDTYDGPRYTYGLTYRPLTSGGAVPDGSIIWSDREHPDFAFGTVDYPAPLPAQTVENYQLTPIHDQPQEA